MSRMPQILPPLRDSIPCPLRAAIGISLGLATGVVATRAVLWLVALWTPAEILEDLWLPVWLLTGATFVAMLALMGSVVQRNERLSHFFCWCSDDVD
jgi:hypothetical protein